MKDQAAHFAVGFCFGLLVGEPIRGAVAGLLAGLVREFTEWQLTPKRGRLPFAGHGSIFSSGSLLDMAVWTLGGLVGGLV